MKADTLLPKVALWARTQSSSKSSHVCSSVSPFVRMEELDHRTHFRKNNRHFSRRSTCVYNLVSSLSSCKYVRIRSNNGWSSVLVRTIIYWDGIVGPLHLWAHTHTAYASCTLAMPLNYTGYVLETRYYQSFCWVERKQDTLRRSDPPAKSLQLINTRTCLLQTAFLSSTTVAWRWRYYWQGNSDVLTHNSNDLTPQT